MRMSELGDLLGRIVPPPASPGFHDDLWDRIHASEREAVKRRRWISAVLAAVAIAGGSAAGVLALGRGGQVLDKTFACPVGNYDQLSIGGYAGARYSSASVLVRPDLVFQAFVSAQSGKGSIVWPPQYAGCQQVSRAVPLKVSGLPALPVGAHAGGYRGASAQCTMPAKILLRARITLDDSGRPTALALAVVNAIKVTPIAFFDLRPPGAKGYAAKSCQPG